MDPRIDIPRLNPQPFWLKSELEQPSYCKRSCTMNAEGLQQWPPLFRKTWCPRCKYDHWDEPLWGLSEDVDGQVEWEFNECYAFIHPPPQTQDFDPLDYGPPGAGVTALQPSDSHEVVTALSFWKKRIPRMSTTHRQALTITEIRWNLSPDVSMADSFNHQLKFCLAAIDARKGMGYMQAFKIGITHKPCERWGGMAVKNNCSLKGYAHEGWREFVILCVHDDSDFIASLEKECLLTYRRYDSQGCLVNSGGDHLNLNRAPGGESAHHGIPPHLLYLVVK